MPKLDYCCCVWDPSTSVLVKRLESVNKFAAKICTKRWSGPSPLSLLGWVLFYFCVSFVESSSSIYYSTRSFKLSILSLYVLAQIYYYLFCLLYRVLCFLTHSPSARLIFLLSHLPYIYWSVIFSLAFGCYFDRSMHSA